MKIIEMTEKKDDNYQSVRAQLAGARITVQLNGLEAVLLFCLTGSISGNPDKSIRGEADMIYHALGDFLADNGATLQGFRFKEAIGLSVGLSKAADLPERS